MGKINRPEPNQGKNITTSPSSSGSTNKLKPLFSFEYLVQTHSVEACEHDDRAALAVQLSKIGCMTWAEIQNAPKHGLGHEKIAQNAIKKALPPVVTPDVNLIAFRFSGKKPMIGFRSDQTFFILFLDRDFTVYNH